VKIAKEHFAVYQNWYSGQATLLIAFDEKPRSKSKFGSLRRRAHKSKRFLFAFVPDFPFWSFKTLDKKRICMNKAGLLRHPTGPCYLEAIGDIADEIELNKVSDGARSAQDWSEAYLDVDCIRLLHTTPHIRSGIEDKI